MYTRPNACSLCASPYMRPDIFPYACLFLNPCTGICLATILAWCAWLSCHFVLDPCTGPDTHTRTHVQAQRHSHAPSHGCTRMHLHVGAHLCTPIYADGCSNVFAHVNGSQSCLHAYFYSNVFTHVHGSQSYIRTCLFTCLYTRPWQLVNCGIDDGGSLVLARGITAAQDLASSLEVSINTP